MAVPARVGSDMTSLSGLDGGPSAQPRATMRDVAALAGVSLKTVSRVVNGEPGVTEPLARTVLAAAERLQYRPNLGASSLRRSGGRTATIGLLLPDVANPFSSALHRAVEDVAVARGVAVLAASLDEDPDREVRLAEAFATRRVDGLIVVPASHDHGYLRAEQRAGTALVFVDRPPVLLDADAVLADGRAGAASGVRHLVGHGHRRIGFLGDLATITTAQDRLQGYRDALANAGLADQPDLVRSDLRTIEQAESAAVALMGRRHPPTALFAGQNLVTIGAIRALRRLGRQHEVALVGFDDFPLADLLEPAVTVVAQDPSAMGTLAAQLLFARIDGDAGPTTTRVVPTRLVPRGSGELPARG